MDIINKLPTELIEIDYDSLDLMIQELPLELVEKIRRFTYKTQPSELLAEIIYYGSSTLLLNNICKEKRITKNVVKVFIKYFHHDNQELIPYKYTHSINIFKRYYKYKNYNNFILIDKISNTKSFGQFWGILHNFERLSILKYIHNNVF